MFREIINQLLPAPAKLPKPKVLIVEDDDQQRRLFAEVIHSYGYKAISASSQREAIDFIDTSDIMLLDWRLNGDAQNLLDLWTAKSTTQRPVAVVSAHISNVSVEALFRAGVYNVLTKPVTIETLMTVVRHYVSDVQNTQKLIRLEREVLALRRLTIALVIALAAVASGLDINTLRSLF